MLAFFAGTVVMFGSLAGIGLTRGRWVSATRWVALWCSTSVALLAAMVAGLVLSGEVLELSHGLAFGYVIGVTVHTVHHALDTVRDSESAVRP